VIDVHAKTLKGKRRHLLITLFESQTPLPLLGERLGEGVMQETIFELRPLT
jgi:hypothetical protein